MRKLTADRIFDGEKFLGPGTVLLMRGDSVEAIISADDAGSDVDRYDGMLCPGFVNAHCHLELSHLKGKIPEHTGLVDFLATVMHERAATSEEKQEAMLKALEEMRAGGIVAVGDICNTADSVGVKAASNMHFSNFIEISGFIESTAADRFAQGQRVLEAFQKNLPQQYSSLTPHSPYSVSNTLFDLLNDETARNLISIHNVEADAENELFEKGSGDLFRLYGMLGLDVSSFTPPQKRSVPHWLGKFNKAQKILAVHDVFLNEDDLKFIDRHTTADVSFCVCINANLYIDNILPPVELMMRSGRRICLGTDSLASNHALSIIAEIRSLQKYFPSLSDETILHWATLAGAEALNISDRFGSFVRGKRPGVLQLQDEKLMVLI